MRFKVEGIKDIAIVITIVISIAGAAMAVGENKEKIKNNKDKIESIKDDDLVKINEEIINQRKVDVEQSKILERATTQLNANTKLIDKLEKRIEAKQ